MAGFHVCGRSAVVFIAIILTVYLSAAGSALAQSGMNTRSLYCPPKAACDAALGIAITPTPGVRQAAPGKYPLHHLVLQIPAKPGQPDSTVRLDIASWGTIHILNGKRAATAGMARLLRGVRVTQRERTVHYGAGIGVQVNRVPSSPAYVTAIVIAHQGFLYKILAPGSRLAADQKRMLSSIRFIARKGPFPPSNG